jgi:hypothetical protein
MGANSGNFSRLAQIFQRAGVMLPIQDNSINHEGREEHEVSE